MSGWCTILVYVYGKITAIVNKELYKNGSSLVDYNTEIMQNV